MRVAPPRAEKIPVHLATAASAAAALPADAWLADRSSCELRAASHAIVPLLAHGAADFVAARAWSPLGFSRLCDHVRERFDRSDRWLHEFAALGRAMSASPQLERALLGWDGSAPIGRMAAAHLARVALPESMDRWIRLARARTVRQLEEIMAACGAMGVEAFAAFELDGAAMAGTASEAAQDIDMPRRGVSSEGAMPNDSAGPSDLHAQALEASDLAALEDELGERADIRFDAPATVQAAFYDTLDVYRAISGYESTIRSFWEALVAEALAGPFPPDVASTPVRRGVSTRMVEHAMARATRNWAHLDKIPVAGCAASAADAEAIAASWATNGNGVRTPRPQAPQMHSDSDASPGGAEDGDSGASPGGAEGIDSGGLAGGAEDNDSDGLPGGAEDGVLGPASDDGRGAESDAVSPAELERRVQVLLACDDALERHLGEVLYGMSQRNDWATLGFTSLGHYATERLGIPRSTAYARVAILRDLKRLRHVLDAYREGTIGFEAAQMLAKILKGQSPDAKVERAWIAHAQQVTVKRLRDELRYFRQQALGETAASYLPPSDDEVKHDKVRLASNATQPAESQIVNGQSLSMGAEDTSLANGPLHSTSSNVPRANSPRSVRLPLPDAVWDCSLRRAPGDTLDRLARLHVPGEDPTVPTSSALANGGSAMRFRLPAELADQVRAALEAARQRVTAQVMPLVDEDEVDLQWLAPSKRGALVALQRGRRVPTWVGMLALLEDFAVTWDNPAGFPKREKDAVYEKAGFRCQAPGCTRRCNIEDHHLVYKSHQGGDELWNQLCLCRFHHQQGEHGFFARCRGRAPLEVMWRLGVKECGVLYRNERRV